MEERKQDAITWMGVSDIAGAKILKIKGTLNHRALKAIFCPLQRSQSGQKRGLSHLCCILGNETQQERLQALILKRVGNVT